MPRTIANRSPVPPEDLGVEEWLHEALITISKVGNNVQLQWTSGTLLQATNLLGPWITNAVAVSPYILSPTNAQQFFRTQ